MSEIFQVNQYVASSPGIILSSSSYGKSGRAAPNRARESPSYHKSNVTVFVIFGGVLVQNGVV